MRTVRVVSYEESWKTLFEQEEELLQNVYGNELIAVHHVGSTSVKGLQAKPIIDIMPVVKNIHEIDLYNEKMEKMGYEPMGEFGIPGRRYFRKGGDKRTHHVHIFEKGSPHIARHLAFRDYLRTHPADAARYGAVKTEAAFKFPDDIELYISMKEPVLLEIEEKAVRWYDEKNKGSRL